MAGEPEDAYIQVAIQQGVHGLKCRKHVSADTANQQARPTNTRSGFVLGTIEVFRVK